MNEQARKRMEEKPFKKINVGWGNSKGGGDGLPRRGGEGGWVRPSSWGVNVGNKLLTQITPEVGSNWNWIGPQRGKEKKRSCYGGHQ